MVVPGLLYQESKFSCSHLTERSQLIGVGCGLVVERRPTRTTSFVCACRLRYIKTPVEAPYVIDRRITGREQLRGDVVVPLRIDVYGAVTAWWHINSPLVSGFPAPRDMR
ncbi:Uncharacterised protein [Mycobacteroides abscessus subsp. abscessus]|nr:Uncharacterised protein [Mycobacteroides abscessus subsp. abscessus]